MSIVWLLVANVALGQSTASLQDTRPRTIPKSFSNSVLYGVGAGTLVGIAALTNFKKDIGKNADISNIARGASYGLYAGILLGLYLTYGVSDFAPSPPRDNSDQSKFDGSSPHKPEKNLQFSLEPELTTVRSSITGLTVGLKFSTP